MVTIDVAGKKSMNPVADVTMTREKGKDNRIVVEYPVSFLSGTLFLGTEGTIQGRLRELKRGEDPDDFQGRHRGRYEKAQGRMTLRILSMAIRP